MAEKQKRGKSDRCGAREVGSEGGGRELKEREKQVPVRHSEAAGGRAEKRERSAGWRDEHSGERRRPVRFVAGGLVMSCGPQRLSPAVDSFWSSARENKMPPAVSSSSEKHLWRARGRDKGAQNVSDESVGARRLPGRAAV